MPSPSDVRLPGAASPQTKLEIRGRAIAADVPMIALGLAICRGFVEAMGGEAARDIAA